MNARMTAAALAALLLAIPATIIAQSAEPPAAVTVSSGNGPSFSQSAPEPARAPRGSGSYDWQVPQATTAPPQPSSGSATPQMPRVPMARMQRGQLLNVKVEFTITDQIGTKPAIKKTMTMVVADGESSRIRSTVEFRVPMTVKNDKGELVKISNSGNAPLSVDVSPAVEGNRIRLDFSVEYSATDLQEDGSLGSKTTVSERLAAVLDSGVPLIVAQSSDAFSDRKVTVEIKATILK